MKEKTRLKRLTQKTDETQRVFLRFLALMRKIGLSDDVTEAIEETHLLLNVLRAMLDYCQFKSDQLERKKETK